MTAISQEQLLAEVEGLLRTVPDRATIRHPTTENDSWFGRAAAIVEEWNSAKGIAFQTAYAQFNTQLAFPSSQGLRIMMVLLNQVRHDLRMRTVGPTNIAVPQGGVFDYFDEIRKTTELANQEVFFVDPYLDAEFISRYLPHIRPGVDIRLLTSDKKLATLLPATDLFIQQNNRAIHIRSNTGLHDRYVFTDKANCYQSGASFKDGAKASPTTLTQITDAFNAVWKTYEDLWNTAKVER